MTSCGPGRTRIASRCARPSWSGTAGRRRRRRCATSSPATRCRTAGTPPTATKDGGCWRRPAPTAGDLPVLITTEGEPLIAPSEAEVASRVGPGDQPRQRDFYDLVVVGGGPAGLGAAVYGASEGLRTVLVEKFATGGQAGQTSRIENYLGFPDGVSGGQLTDRARRQAVKFGAELLTTQEVAGLEVNGPARTLAARRRQRDRRARRSSSPPGCPTGSSTRPGATEMTGRGRLLRGGADRGRGVQGPGRLRRRRGQLGRPGRRLPVPVRPVGDDAGARPLARAVDVVLPDPADRRHREHLRPHLHRGHRGARRRSPRAAHAARPEHRRDRGGRRRPAVHLHRGGAEDGLAGRRGGARRPRLHRGRAGPEPDRAPPAAGRSTARRTTWRRACPGYSRPATCARIPPSESPRPWEKAPWPSCWSIATWRHYDRQPLGDRAGKAAAQTGSGQAEPDSRCRRKRCRGVRPTSSGRSSCSRS